MVENGVLEDPKPDACFALHLWNEQSAGWLGISEGPVMSASDEFRIQVIGNGGHAAAPHISIDPVLASAQVINTLQSIVSRNVPPLDSAVVTVTSIHGGEAFNVIPPEINLKGTIRTFEPAVRNQILIRFREPVTGVAKSMGCQVEIDVQKITPLIVNDHDLTLKRLTLPIISCRRVRSILHTELWDLKIWRI